jgi:signal transduction histidine kinase
LPEPYQSVRRHLDQLVTDIAAARADSAVAAGRPAPRFDIRVLQPVLADPPLVRQLLDNLIGNAIKYTALSGITPAISITTAGQVDGRVTVTITDNGVGIPAGQQ